MSSLFEQTYNPDVLSCLANLSNDEVFTPPDVANQMLDLLPAEIWADPDVKILDPACKSGVFLREAAKRMIGAQLPGYAKRVEAINRKKRDGEPLTEGDEGYLAYLQEVVDHIFKEQLYGIAITELTSLLSRRSVYCSKYPNSKYSVAQFDADDVEGSIRFKNCKHVWKDERCAFCGASKKTLDEAKRDGLEIHAYEFIHVNNPEELLKLKFDVIISNPPYQLNVGVVKENYAVPIYQKFVQQAKKLNPRHMVMITPSRWFTGGRGLNEFRKEMLEDKRLKEIVDYTDSKDCFPGVDIAGGVSYFLWSRDYRGECRFTNMCKGSSVTAMRSLDEFVVFPRQNDALAIIHKVREATSETLESMVGPQTPFGLVSSFDGNAADGAGMLKLKSSRRLSYVSAKQVTKNRDWIPKYKVIFSKATCEHAGTPDKNGQYRVFSSNGILCPDVICTQSYLVGGTFDSLAEAENYLGFLHSKFARFLLLQALTSQDLSKEKFLFVPKLDWKEQWTDERLFAQFGLTNSEIEIINSTIREMPEADSFVIER